MQIKHSPGYKIEKKYNRKEKLINFGQHALGTITGLGFAADLFYNFASKTYVDKIDGLEYAGFVALGLLTYFGGNFLRKRNKKRKQKALENLAQK